MDKSLRGLGLILKQNLHLSSTKKGKGCARLEISVIQLISSKSTGLSAMFFHIRHMAEIPNTEKFKQISILRTKNYQIPNNTKFRNMVSKNLSSCQKVHYYLILKQKMINNAGITRHSHGRITCFVFGFSI